MPWPSTDGRFARRQRRRDAVAGDARQIKRERAALADFAGDHDLTAGLFGKAEHLRKSEARALPDFLGREEWLEDVLELIGRNTAAGVGY